MNVTRQGRKWRWLLHRVSEPLRRSVTLTVADGVASGAGPNHRELVIDRLPFLPGSQFKRMNILFSTAV
jgi:hypothetical protein